MQKTRHGIQASPYGTQHNGHTNGFRTVQHTGSRYSIWSSYNIQHTPPYTTIHHHTPYTRVAYLADIARMSYTCSAVLPAPTVSIVAPLRGSLACACAVCAVPVRAAQCISEQQFAYSTLPCFLAALHPPLLHPLRLTDGYEIVDCGLDCPF